MSLGLTGRAMACQIHLRNCCLFSHSLAVMVQLCAVLGCFMACSYVTLLCIFHLASLFPGMAGIHVMPICYLQMCSSLWQCKVWCLKACFTVFCIGAHSHKLVGSHVMGAAQSEGCAMVYLVYRGPCTPYICQVCMLERRTPLPDGQGYASCTT